MAVEETADGYDKHGGWCRVSCMFSSITEEEADGYCTRQLVSQLVRVLKESIYVYLYVLVCRFDLCSFKKHLNLCRCD